VRLDVGEVHAPWRILGLLDELHGAPRHIRRLGILLAHARRLARMTHRPAGGERVALAGPGIGVVMPGVVAGVAFGVEVIPIEWPLSVIAAVRTARVQAVVAVERIEAALRYAHADDRFRIDAEPLHAF